MKRKLTPEKLSASDPMTMATIYDTGKFYKFGADINQFLERVGEIVKASSCCCVTPQHCCLRPLNFKASFEQVLCINKGAGPGGKLSWNELEALVPLDDSHFFLDRIAGQRVLQIAKSRRTTPVAQYLSESCCAAVLHHPEYRILPNGKPSGRTEEARKLADSVAHQVGVHPPTALIARSGIGKSPTIDTNVTLIENIEEWPDELIIIAK